MKNYFLSLLVLPGLFCGSSFIKRDNPANNSATVKSGEIIQTTLSIRERSGNKIRVYKTWIFMEADNKKVYLNYIENYDTPKTNPDLIEKKSVLIENNSILIDRYILNIYELKRDTISYVITINES